MKQADFQLSIRQFVSRDFVRATRQNGILRARRAV